MRRLTIIICGLILTILCAGLLVFTLVDRREKSFPDGSVIRIEKIAYGHQEHFELGGPLEKLKKAVTEFWRRRYPPRGPIYGGAMSTWWDNTLTHSNEPALYIYVSRRKPGQGYQNASARAAQLVDADGCVYAPTQSGGWDDGTVSATIPGANGMRYSVGWFRFEAFPRREKKFRFELFNDPTNLAWPPPKTSPLRFEISNPAPATPAAEWTAEPLPITRIQDKLAITLAKITVQPNQFGYGFGAVKQKGVDAHYSFLEDGTPSSNWLAKDAELYDSSGNFVSGQYVNPPCLCPREPAWKLVVKFFGTEESRAASNTSWTLPGLAVPAPGEYLVLNRTNDLQGVAVKAGVFGGRGDFTYSNCIALAAKRLDKPLDNNSTSIVSWPNSSPGSTAKPTFDLHTKSPHLAI
jgi:hypothetical protein